MEKNKIIDKLINDLEAIQNHLFIRFLDDKIIAEISLDIDRAISTISRSELLLEQRELIEKYEFLLKVIYHYFKIKHCVDTRIINLKKVDEWLIAEINYLINEVCIQKLKN